MLLVDGLFKGILLIFLANISWIANIQENQISKISYIYCKRVDESFLVIVFSKSTKCENFISYFEKAICLTSSRTPSIKPRFITIYTASQSSTRQTCPVTWKKKNKNVSNTINNFSFYNNKNSVLLFHFDLNERNETNEQSEFHLTLLTLFHWNLIEFSSIVNIFSFNLPRISARLQRLMGTNVVRLTDRKYMQQLRNKIDEDYKNQLDKRIQTREVRLVSHKNWWLLI